MTVSKIIGSAIGIIIGLCLASLIYFIIAIPFAFLFMLLAGVLSFIPSISFADSVFVWWTIITLIFVVSAWMSEK